MKEPQEEFHSERMGAGLAIVLILTFWLLIALVAKLAIWLIRLY